MLAAPSGTEIEIRVDGPDAETALHELIELVKSGFGENGAP
jgi:phosphotransferase system HPr-like phosphotransfer protein